MDSTWTKAVGFVAIGPTGKAHDGFLHDNDNVDCGSDRIRMKPVHVLPFDPSALAALEAACERKLADCPDCGGGGKVGSYSNWGPDRVLLETMDCSKCSALRSALSAFRKGAESE